MTEAVSVGVFDSGVGGLSVLREIRRQMPAARLLYVADSRHAPYGERSRSFIRQRAFHIADFLLNQGIDALVVACNTATAAAVIPLRHRLTLPVVGMEPAIKPGVSATHSGAVGVLATSGTLASARFAALLRRFDDRRRVLTQPCPGLVEQVERGELTSLKTRRLLSRYLQPLLQRGVDTLVLGCTHYPFLRPMIEEIAGRGVTLIDTGEAVARRLCEVLRLGDPAPGGEGETLFWSSGELQRGTATMRALWDGPVDLRALPEPPLPLSPRAPD